MKVIQKFSYPDYLTIGLVTEVYTDIQFNIQTVIFGMDVVGWELGLGRLMHTNDFFLTYIFLIPKVCIGNIVLSC